MLDESKGFSVKGCYELQSCLRFSADFDADFLAAVQRLWDLSVPSKVGLFGWRLLQDRLPTQIELWRGVIHDVHQQS
jgi:hypothetical protein